MNQQARKQANLRLLQRSVDPTVTDILGSATHVVLYHFQQTTQQWEKSNVEGSLLLAVRPSGYLLLILNRNSTENFQLSLNKDFQLQHNNPYLIFKQLEGGATVIRGIWFPNANEREEMHTLLMQVLTNLKDPSVVPVASMPAGGVTSANMFSSSSFSSTTPTAGQGTGATTAPASIDPGSAMAALLSPLTLAGNATTTATTITTPSNDAFANLAGTPPTTTTTTTTTTTGGSTSSLPPRQISPSMGTQPPTLDKKSLQLALLSLIQDDRFLDLLHAQYLKVAHARANRNKPDH